MNGPESTAPVADFRLSLPLAWVELDLNPATRAGSIARIVDERGEAGQALGLARPQLVDMLESIAAQAEAKNGVYAAAEQLNRLQKLQKIVNIPKGDYVAPGLGAKLSSWGGAILRDPKAPADVVLKYSPSAQKDRKVQQRLGQIQEGR